MRARRIAVRPAQGGAEKRIFSLLTEVVQMDIVTLFRQSKLEPMMFREALLSLLKEEKIHGGRGRMGKFWALSKKEWAKERHYFYSQGFNNTDYEGLRKAIGRLKDFEWIWLMADIRERSDRQRTHLGLIYRDRAS